MKKLKTDLSKDVRNIVQLIELKEETANPDTVSQEQANNSEVKEEQEVEKELKQEESKSEEKGD